jgi:hypothetical protein
VKRLLALTAMMALCSVLFARRKPGLVRSAIRCAKAITRDAGWHDAEGRDEDVLNGYWVRFTAGVSRLRVRR